MICEGELDAIVLSQYGVDAVTTTGGAGSLPRFFQNNRIGVTNIYVATDQDDPGNQSATELANVLYGKVLRCHWDGGSDISARLMEVPIDERAQEIRRWFDTAIQMKGR